MTYKTCLVKLAKSLQKNILYSKGKRKLSTIDLDISKLNLNQLHLQKKLIYNLKKKFQRLLIRNKYKLLKPNSFNRKITSNSLNHSLSNSLDKLGIIPNSVMIINHLVVNIMSNLVNQISTFLSLLLEQFIPYMIMINPSKKPLPEK